MSKNRPARPISSHTDKIQTGCGTMYVTISDDPDWPEVFFKLGKPGCCAAAFLQALGRVCSFSLRAKVPKERLIHALKEIVCPNPQWSDGQQVLSCPDAIAKVLERE